ncbi:MAG TPA: response regulator [Actinomycetota bacterium]|nr:response regulator [Actinomycetota bacterium]
MKVLLVDDHAPIRASLRQLLEMRPGYQVVGEGSNGREAVAAVDTHAPDVVLMDMNMPVMNGVEATRAIKERHPDVKVLALTAFGDMSLVSASIKAGASGYLLKGGSAEELLNSLAAVAVGQGALDKEVTRGVIDDVATLYRSEQERAASLEELDRMKSEFVSVVSHELRTPLTGIKGGVRTLQAGWAQLDDPTKLELLDNIDHQCDRLTHLVDQILTVSGIQSGGLGLAADRFSLGEVAQAVVASLMRAYPGRSVEVDAAPDVEAAGDRGRIVQVALALVKNALEHTQGPVRVAVASSGGTARLSIEDEGPGLDDRLLDRLLTQPFEQADSSATRTVGGLGLSIYIARRVLEASGGRLEALSSPDGGSTFTMVAPLARPR